MTSVCFAGNTHYVFSTSKDGSIKQWDADSFTQIQVLHARVESEDCVIFFGSCLKDTRMVSRAAPSAKKEVSSSQVLSLFDLSFPSFSAGLGCSFSLLLVLATLSTKPPIYIFRLGSQDKSFRVWVRTREMLNLEEELELEREAEYEKELEEREGREARAEQGDDEVRPISIVWVCHILYADVTVCRPARQPSARQSPSSKQTGSSRPLLLQLKKMPSQAVSMHTSRTGLSLLFH